jgi:tetratricopeptide (TPR) repeat protein
MPTKRAAGAKGASKQGGAGAKGTCFVVMGFGKKVDFETGRTLDLDKTYKNIIKPAVSAAGLECIRADEIVHSGLIDVPMYEQLLNADVVVADLSTSNKNAFYELGVRHALKPYTTIVICEDGFKTFPFDINHIAIRQYHHMGTAIDANEIKRFRGLLKKAIVEIFNKDPRSNDSPVYTFLSNLTPPALAKAMKGVAEAAAKSAPGADADGAAPAGDAQTHSELMRAVDDAQKGEDFATAKTLLKFIQKRISPNAPEYSYIVQRLALVTYKSEQPTPKQALEEARALLGTLSPETSNDTETLGLWGAVHKRLWDLDAKHSHLDEAVRGYERGFYLRNDYYNGINFAYLLNVRAAHAGSRAEAIADFVQAERVRREVLAICEQWLGDNPAPAGKKATKEAMKEYLSNKYWVVATQAEAYLGMGQTAKADKTYKAAYAFAPASWMVTTSTEPQRKALTKLLADSPLKYVKTSGR